MKFAYFNPTVIAVENVNDETFQYVKDVVTTAHQFKEHNDAGDQSISIRGGQQIHLLPNAFGLDVTQLESYIKKIAHNYLHGISEQSGRDLTAEYEPMVISIWTIRQEADHYQALHSHKADISGNLYIEVPKFSEDRNSTDGNIEFRLPTIRDEKKFILTDQVRFAPVEKNMLIFPSYIPHTVYPWKGTGHRTVLAWDVELISKNG
jgi:hypothetical protein